MTGNLKIQPIFVCEVHIRLAVARSGVLGFEISPQHHRSLDSDINWHEPGN